MIDVKYKTLYVVKVPKWATYLDGALPCLLEIANVFWYSE